MNKKRAILGPLILALGLWGAALTIGSLPLIQGCSTSGQKTAYKSLYSSHVLADGAFSGYMSAVLAGTVPTNNVPKAGNAYRHFQTVFNVALQAAMWNTNAPATAEVSSALADLVTQTTH